MQQHTPLWQYYSSIWQPSDSGSRSAAATAAGGRLAAQHATMRMHAQQASTGGAAAGHAGWNEAVKYC